MNYHGFLSKSANCKFTSISWVGTNPFFVGRPGKIKKKSTSYGALIDDWSRCVRNLTVSSKEGNASRLIDGDSSTFWQSQGSQGKVITPADRETISLISGQSYVSSLCEQKHVWSSPISLCHQVWKSP